MRTARLYASRGTSPYYHVQDRHGRETGVGLGLAKVWTEQCYEPKFESWPYSVHGSHVGRVPGQFFFFMIQFDSGRNHLVLVWDAVRGRFPTCDVGSDQMC